MIRWKLKKLFSCHVYIYWRIVASAQRVEVSLPGVGTVPRLERNVAWSMGQWSNDQGKQQITPLFFRALSAGIARERLGGGVRPPVVQHAMIDCSSSSCGGFLWDYGALQFVPPCFIFRLGMISFMLTPPPCGRDAGKVTKRIFYITVCPVAFLALGWGWVENTRPPVRPPARPPAFPPIARLRIDTIVACRLRLIVDCGMGFWFNSFSLKISPFREPQNLSPY